MPEQLLALLVQPSLYAACLLCAAATVLWVWLLTYIPLSAAYPFVALSFKDHWRADVSSMIWSGRNHPSVVMWSLGNEIPNLTDETGWAEAKALAELVHELDPMRPTTAAVHMGVDL
jgi:beta-galactosidase/beta-glucuronidase